MARSKQQAEQLRAFGANVRRLRARAGWTQARLAELAEVELRTAQKWEAGEIDPPLTTVARIQAVLRCPWDELLGKPRLR